MQASILVVLFAFFSALLPCVESVVNTQYWDPDYPFQLATCANRNESIMVGQTRIYSRCYDGTDMPWTQVPNPKSRLYFCTDDGDLMYQECTPFQYTGSTNCKLNCSAPIVAGVDEECYHGTRLNVISCERGATTITGTYYKKDSPSSMTSYIYGPQTCEDAYGPNLKGYSCNTTHYWELTNCQYACTNCIIGNILPIASPDVCINSKVLSCYAGYTSNVSAVVPIVTRTVDSDTVCARFDYKCHIGDCTCSKTEQTHATCKRGHEFMSNYDCTMLPQYTSPEANVLCCGTNLCNAPSAWMPPCIVTPPTPKPTLAPTPAPTAPPTPLSILIWDEQVESGWTAGASTNVLIGDSVNPQSGSYDIAFSSLNTNPYVLFSCRGCVSTAAGYNYISFYATSSSTGSSVTMYVMDKSTRIDVQTIALTSSYRRYKVYLPLGTYGAVGFEFGNAAITRTSRGFLDVVTLV